MSEAEDSQVGGISEPNRTNLSSVLVGLKVDFLQMATELRRLADEAGAQGENDWAVLLQLLAQVCSLSLMPGNGAQPFRAFWESPTGRSFALDDLKAQDLRVIAEIAPLAPKGPLAARLYDISWHSLRPRNPDFALAAIDLYRLAPLTEMGWISGGREAWYRAIALSRMVKDRAGSRLGEIQTTLTDSLFAASSADGYLSIWLADALKTNRFPSVPAQQIADHLETIAIAFAQLSDLGRSADYYEAAAIWYKLDGDEKRETDMIVCVAERKYDEAQQRLIRESASQMAASSFIEEAVQALRRIPAKYRAHHSVDQRIIQLQQELRESRQESLGEMRSVSTGPVDVSELVRIARDSVTGKSLPDAIKGLVSLSSITKYEEARQHAKDVLRASPLMAFIGGSVIGHDGRVVAKKPSFDSANPDAESNEVAIFAQMVQTHSMSIGLRVNALILPALEAIRGEHSVTIELLHILVRQSPIVPTDRALLIARGLHCGFEENWVAAAHILVPQLENIVRQHLKVAGVITTVMDAKGITNEVGLSTLMDLPEVDTIFGEDLAFEIRALFCSHFGPNLRNELAHGLLDDDQAESAATIYAWWFVLLLVKRAWLSVQQARSG